MPAESVAISNTTDFEERFDLLFTTNYQAIYRYCLRRLGPADAEDAAADVFAVAWRRIDDMPRGEGGRAWLYGVAYRVVGNRFRSRRRQTRLSLKLRAQPVSAQGPADLISTASAEAERVLQALGRLSSSDQELLRLASWDGLTRDEISVVLDINRNAVDQRLHRARSRFKAHFDRVGPSTSTSSEEVSP